MKRSALLSGGSALAAIVFLIAMVVIGAMPKQRQLVKFEAKGVMQVAPERVSTVAISAGARNGVFARTPDGGWAKDDGAPLDASLAKRLSLAVQFMNTSGPVRELGPGDYSESSLREFGLQPPRLSVALFDGARPVVTAHFGGRNPDGYLEYMRVEGQPQIYLLSRFVGEEWDAVVQGALK